MPAITIYTIICESTSQPRAKVVGRPDKWTRAKEGQHDVQCRSIYSGTEYVGMKVRFSKRDQQTGGTAECGTNRHVVFCLGTLVHFVAKKCRMVCFVAVSQSFPLSYNQL